MNIVSLFESAVADYPEHIAIIHGGKEITYGDLLEDVLKTTAYFEEKGIRKGDRVLVFVPMSIDLYRIVLALFSIGSTAVFLDEWVSKKRMELCCEIADCKGFIGVFKARIFTFFSKELRRIPVKLRLKGMSNRKKEPVRLLPSDPALITFTTGSTGRPKAANRTHGFLKEQFDALLEEIDPKPQDVDMPLLPIVLFVNLGVGCTSVITDFKISQAEKANFSSIISLIKSTGTNRIIASPFFIDLLAEHVIEQKVFFPELRQIFTGGAPVFPKSARLYTEAFPETDIEIVYGSTEAEPISKISALTIAGIKVINDGLPVGKVYHKTQLKIIPITESGIDDQSLSSFESLEIPEGGIGEIVVAGPHILKAYYNSPEAFRKNKIRVDQELWHRTGDSGFIRDGELFLTGRCAQLIVHEGNIISPFITENRLLETEGIKTGTILKMGNELVLCAETLLTVEEVEKRITGIRYDRVLILRHIPRDPRHHSKIDYGKLRKTISG